MNLRSLESFVVAAEELHFNRAARRLHVSQPSLSQQIQRLEQEYGTRLFDRDTRNVRLTPSGQVLFEHAARILAQYGALVSAVGHARDGESGTIRLGFVASAAIRTIPRIVRAADDEYPGVRLELHELTTTPQIEAIQNMSLDVGIAREVYPAAGLDVALIEKESLIVAAPTTHRLATQPAVALRDLHGESFVAFPRDAVSRLFDHIGGLLDAAGVEFRIAQEAVQFPTILGLVAAGRGIAIVPDCMRVLALPGIRYLSLTDESAVSQVCLIRRTPGTQRSSLVDRVAELVLRTGLTPSVRLG